MSEDLTKKLPKGDSENITLILTLVRSIESRIDRLERRLDDFERWLNSLEKKVDERLYDTRPIWEKVVADIGQLQEGQQRLEADVREIKSSAQDIFLQISVISETMVAMQAKHKGLDNRVRDLELQHKPTNSQT